MSNSSRNFFLAFAALALLCASAQAESKTTPCGTAFDDDPLPGTHALISVAGGTVVYDANQSVCWLADANLAGHPEVRAAVTLSPTNRDGSTPVINLDGTMDYETAVNWVNALNLYNHGRGWQNHNNWQLPTNPHVDKTCSSIKVDNFGVQCTGGALSNLNYVGLERNYPDSVAPYFFSFVYPFLSLQPGLYWTSDSNGGGEVTFSFNTGINGSNTTRYNFLHALPMTKDVLGPLPTGKGVLPYLGGAGAGRAVYDTSTGTSWLLNANLSAINHFGFNTTTTITTEVSNNVLTVPDIDKDGAMLFAAVDPANQTSGWIVSMNAASYAGSNRWTLPSLNDLFLLYGDMNIRVGDTRLEWPFFTGPFVRLQPGFYWACVRANGTSSNGPCDLTQDAPSPIGTAIPLEWSFNFDDGFEGSDERTKEIYVEVYYPAP